MIKSRISVKLDIDFSVRILRLMIVSIFETFQSFFQFGLNLARISIISFWGFVV